MKKKKTVTIISVLFSLLLLINIFCRFERNSLKELELDIYIPSGPSCIYRSKYLGLEKLWIYKTNQADRKSISKEITESKWNLLDKEDYEKYLEVFIYYNGSVTRRLSFKNTYYIIYSPYTESCINISDLTELADNKTNFVIFIYDETNNYYFTSYDAMQT